MAQESEDDKIRCDEMEQYSILEETVKQNIDYDVLLYTGFRSPRCNFQICPQRFHLFSGSIAYFIFKNIQYVISSMKKNTTEIKNIKKYLLAALYNAPATMQGYYQAAVNHDMQDW